MKFLNSIVHYKKIVAALVMVPAVFLFIAGAVLAEEYRNIKTIGSYGTKEGALYYPCGVAVDSVGNVYVTDWKNRKVTKFSADGRFILDFETKSRMYMRLKGPAGIAIDSADNIFVVDQYLAKVFKYSLDGKFIGSFGSYGSTQGKFLNPRGIAVDSENSIYVADHDNFRVQKFNSKGDFMAELKYMNVETKKYARPRGVACDASNNVYVVYSEIFKVVVFSAEGKMTADFGESGALPGQFKNPRYAACDNVGNVYVTDYDNHRVQKFNKNLKFVTTFGTNGKKPENFRNPEGIFVDASGNIFIADALNDRISKWEPEDVIKHANWAALFEKKGLLQDAIGEYLEILKIRPKDQSASQSLIELYLKAAKKSQQTGNSVQARAYYSEVLKFDPLNEIAIRETNELAGGTREERDTKRQNIVLGVLVVMAVVVSIVMTFKST